MWKSPRDLAIVLLVGVAVIHLAVVPEHLSESRPLAALFVLNAVAACLAAVLLGLRSSGWGWLLGLGATIGPLLMYGEVRLFGFLGLHEDVWLEPLGIPALVLEVWYLLVFIQVLRAPNKDVLPRSLQRPRQKAHHRSEV